MLPPAIVCPSCSLPLQSNRLLAPGQQLRCPRCTITFMAPLPAPPPAQGIAPALEPLPDYEIPLPESYPAAPEPAPPQRPQAPPTTGGGLRIGWPAVALVLFLIVILLAGALISNEFPDRPPQPLAALSAPQSDLPAPAQPAPTAPIGTPPRAETPRPQPRVEAPPLPLPAKTKSPAPKEPAPAARPAPAANPKPAPPPPKPEPAPRPAASAPRPDSVVKYWLPAEEQERVDAAIARGIQFLKRRQLASGSWTESFYTTGHAALPALALLECGVPATDPVIEKAVQMVRDQVPTLEHTYEIALAILLLDRLGQEVDEPRIRSLGLRLVSGQEVRGGWTYNCPLLSPQEEDKLFIALRATRPRSPMDLFVQVPDAAPAGIHSPRRPAPHGDLSQPGRDQLDEDLRRPGQPVELLPRPRQSPASTLPLAQEAGRARPPMLGRPPRREAARPEVTRLSPRLRNLPAVQPAQRYQQPDDPDQAEKPSRSDNSNTQFAVLGLWAARRHGIAMDRALALMCWRFQTSQARDGSWGYKYVAGGSREGRPSMTGSALLGLAVGQGLTYDYRQNDQERVPPDPRIRHGLTYLAASIDPPMDRFLFDSNPLLPADRQKGRATAIFPPGRVPPDFDTYLLWTIERVGVLYNLRYLDGRDWYRWGVAQLLAVQQRGGGWPYGRGQERDMVGTSFALLFLKGSNLVADLTSKLEAAEGK